MSNWRRKKEMSKELQGCHKLNKRLILEKTTIFVSLWRSKGSSDWTDPEIDKRHKKNQALKTEDIKASRTKKRIKGSNENEDIKDTAIVITGENIGPKPNPGIMERGFLSLGGSGVKQKNSSDSGAKEGTISTSKLENNMESRMKHGKHADGQPSELESFPIIAEGSFPSLSNAFDSPKPTSLADKIRDIKSQMIEGKLAFLGDERKPLKHEESQAGNEADVAISLTLVLEVNERFSNSVYGFFLGKRFSVKDGMVSMLENAWVKFHDVPLIAFIENGLTAIATKLITPLVLDAYTITMCTESWGRSSYERAMIDLRVDVELKDTLVWQSKNRRSMGDMEDDRDVGHFSTISEYEVNNLEKHGLNSIRVEVVNKDKRVTVKSGCMPSTSFDLHDNSESDVEEYDNEIAHFIAYSYK
ncbi:hypothetical protein Tco_0097842 [Tanacetum coccineum]